MNDLIGLPYQWGAKYTDASSSVDCFSLFVEARKRLSLITYEQNFEWVYQEDSSKLPMKRVLKQIKLIATKTDQPKQGDLAVISHREGHIGLGTYINEGILTIAAGGKSFWTPRIQPLSFWCSIA